MLQAGFEFLAQGFDKPSTGIVPGPGVFCARIGKSYNKLDRQNNPAYFLASGFFAASGLAASDFLASAGAASASAAGASSSLAALGT